MLSDGRSRKLRLDDEFVNGAFLRSLAERDAPAAAPEEEELPIDPEIEQLGRWAQTHKSSDPENAPPRGMMSNVSPQRDAPLSSVGKSNALQASMFNMLSDQDVEGTSSLESVRGTEFFNPKSSGGHPKNAADQTYLRQMAESSEDPTSSEIAAADVDAQASLNGWERGEPDPVEVAIGDPTILPEVEVGNPFILPDEPQDAMLPDGSMEVSGLGIVWEKRGKMYFTPEAGPRMGETIEVPKGSGRDELAALATGDSSGVDPFIEPELEGSEALAAPDEPETSIYPPIQAGGFNAPKLSPDERLRLMGKAQNRQR